MEKKALHVGIDFSKKRADVGIFGTNGEHIIDHRAFSNSRTGYEQFRNLLLETIEVYGGEEVNISGEATSMYWMPFFLAMTEDEALKACNAHQYLLNPRWVAWYKKCFPVDHKTDQRDVFYIADRTRMQKPSYQWQGDPSWLKLRSLTRLRFHLVQDLTRKKNIYQAYLFVLNNAYTQHKPFSDLFGQTSSELLSQLAELDWEITADIHETAQFLDELSGQRLSDPYDKAKKLQKIASERFLINQELAHTLQDILNLLWSHIHFIITQIKQVEQWITQEAKTHQEISCLRSVPGIGLVFSTGIAAEIGDINRFFQGHKWDAKRKCYRPKNLRDVDAAVAKIAGLWWPRSSSGDFEAEDRKLAKSGNRYLRYYLIQAAEQLRRFVPAYATFYHKKYAEVNKHQHKRALILTARKSIRLFVGLLHRKELFCSEEGLA